VTTRGAITAEDWEGFRAELTETREAAAREVEQLTARANQFILPDVDQEVAARLAALREAVAGEGHGRGGVGCGTSRAATLLHGDHAVAGRR
jgi:hypothetical protein